MQVSTGTVFKSYSAGLEAGVPSHDLIEVFGTQAQVDELARAVRRGHAAEAKKAARKAQQRSRRANR